MTGTQEIQHADGTTTVVEVDDSGNYYVYTIDSSTGDRIDNGPSNEIGSNYTLDEVLDSYRREDDVPLDATPEAEATTDPGPTEPGGTDSSETESGVTDPSAGDLGPATEPSEAAPDSEEPPGADGG